MIEHLPSMQEGLGAVTSTANREGRGGERMVGLGKGERGMEERGGKEEKREHG